MTSRRPADTLDSHIDFGIFPHPDDEAYSVAGTFSQLIEEGAHVKLLCVTRVIRGHTAPCPRFGSNLAQVRRNELRKSAEVMGAQEVECLGLRTVVSLTWREASWRHWRKRLTSFSRRFGYIGHRRCLWSHRSCCLDSRGYGCVSTS